MFNSYRNALMIVLCLAQMGASQTMELLHEIQGPFVLGGQDFGTACAFVGDVDKDGHDDFAVGAPVYDDWPQTAFNAGRVYVYSGLTGELIRELEGDTTQSSFFGGAIAGGADIDGDGYADMVISAPRYSEILSTLGEGALEVISGATGSTIYRIVGEGTQLLGSEVAFITDIDGDGVEDIVAGATQTPLGLASSVGAVLAYSGANGTLLWSVSGEQHYQTFGSVAAPGDINRDGIPDVIAGGFNPSKPILKLLSGNDGSELHSWEGLCGTSVAGAGDVNSDGYLDMIVGCPDSDDSVVLSGADYSILYSLDDGNSEDFGWAVGGVGDINSDGYDDVIVGSPSYNSEAGRALIYSGADGTVLFEYVGSSDDLRFGSSVSGAGRIKGKLSIGIGGPGKNELDDELARFYSFTPIHSIESVHFALDNQIRALILAGNMDDQAANEIVTSREVGSNSARYLDVISPSTGETLAVIPDPGAPSVSTFGDSLDYDHANDLLLVSNGINGVPRPAYVFALQDGSYQLVSTLPETTIATFAGDVNGDGNLDCLLSNGQVRDCVNGSYFGAYTGTIAVAVQGVAVGDINQQPGDEVAILRSDATLSLFSYDPENTGLGGASMSPIGVTLPGVIAVTSVDDHNDDGINDLAIGFSNAVQIVSGTTLQLIKTTPISGELRTLSTVKDINDDGMRDVLVVMRPEGQGYQVPIILATMTLNQVEQLPLHSHLHDHVIGNQFGTIEDWLLMTSYDSGGLTTPINSGLIAFNYQALQAPVVISGDIVAEHEPIFAFVNAGPSAANQLSWMLSSYGSQGIPYASFTIPLTFDVLFQLTLTDPTLLWNQNSTLLDKHGQLAMEFSIPTGFDVNAFPGLLINHAHLLLNPLDLSPISVSQNPLITTVGG